MTSRFRTWEFLESGILGIQEFQFHCTHCMDDHPDQTQAFRCVTTGVYVLSCRLTFGPLGLGIFPFLWWFLFVSSGLFFMLHGHMIFHVKPNFQNSFIYRLYVVLEFLSCPSTIRVRVRQGSFWLEFCHSPLSWL